MIVYAYLKFLKYDKAQRPLQFSDLCILNLEILGPVLTHSMVVVSEKRCLETLGMVTGSSPTKCWNSLWSRNVVLGQ